jgi:Zn-dependent membrane protease YugP
VDCKYIDQRNESESTYGKVAGLAAVVAAAVGTAVQAQSGAISLDVSKALAVVALLGY